MATLSGIYRREVFILGLGLLLALWLVPVRAQGSTELPSPTETSQTTLQGAPTCPTGMIAFQPQSNGTNDRMGGTFNDDYLIVNVVISGFDVEWTSNFGVDLLLIHGSDSTNVYAYAPELTSGSGTTPSLSSGQNQAELSHYQFCYDYELRVDVTAAGTFTRAYSWELSKNGDATYTGFIGDPALEHDYLITVDQTVTDSLFMITGDITVYNDSPVQANDVAVSSVVSAGGFDGPVTVLCPSLTVEAKLDGTAGSMVCSYSQEVASDDEGATTATVTATAHGSGSKTVQVLFGPPTVIGYPTVHVTDNLAGELGAVSGDMTYPYSRSFQCPADKPAYTYGVYFMPEVVNTAAIVEVPGASDSATVNLTCYAPLVSKTAVGTYDERYQWAISKTVNPPSQSGFSGLTLPWSWTVNTGEAFVNVQFAVAGTIVVQNPAGAPGSVTIDVSEVLDQALDGSTVATADCDPSMEGNQTSVTLAPGTAGTCNYRAQPTATTATRQSGFAGQTVYYDWQLNWTKYGPVQEGFELHGDITVANPSPMEMTVFLNETISDGTLITIEAGTACAYDAASTVLLVPANSAAICHYTGAPADSSSEVSTVTVNLNSMTFTDVVNVVFTIDQTLDESATITDPSLGFSQVVTSGGLQSFTEYHICPTDQANYTDGVDMSFVDINIATLAGSDGFAGEAVAHNAVTCYAPVVNTSAETSWARSWAWNISKTSSEASVGPILPNQAFVVDSTVTAQAYQTDTDFQIWGTIWISNPHPSASLLLVNVVDLVSPGIAAEVLCPTLAVPAGGSMSCTYRAALPDGSSYNNTAAVSMNYGVPASFSNIPATPVTFSPVSTVETDECVTVLDNPYGPLFNGLQICATGGGDNTFTTTYGVNVGRNDCGSYTYHNVASFETNDTREADSADWDVNVDITCSTICTLSPGYWMAHSIYGPAARPNGAWASVGGPDAPFFLSGQTWYEVLWTAAGGSEYNDLAQQYIAARLNTLQLSPNGVVPPPDAAQALADAEGFFARYTLAQSQSLSEDVRSTAVRNAGILARFNRGLLSAPACDEDSSSMQ